MRKQVRRRFWTEAGMAAASAILLLLTIVWSNWIELVFRMDPDHNSGSLERFIVITLIASTILFIGAARRELGRAEVRF